MTEALAPELPGGHAGILRLASDDRLARHGSRGDRRAFEAIYRRYHQGLYRFCLAMVGNPEDAQDALQNTMVKVVRALPGEKRQITLKPWLYRIARNESIETLRRRRESVELQPEQLAAPREIVDTAADRERLKTLLNDLGELPERQRAALVMRELSGLDFEQIGASFESSAAVARQTLYEARRSLRQMEEGREMSCDAVQRELSDADGRVTRRRELRAHLRDCPSCHAFREEIVDRKREFAAISPLPLLASAGILHGVFGGKASAAIAGSALAKSAATVAVVVGVGVGVTAADRGGLVDLPLPGGGQAASSNSEAGSGGAAPAAPGRAADGGQTAGPRRDGKPSGPRPGAGASAHSSKANAGFDPPGGGYGRSAAERGGKPEQLPDAASAGRATAEAKQPQQAAAPPASGQSGPEATGGSTQTPAPPAAAPPSSQSQAPPGPAESSAGKGGGPGA